MTEGSLVIRLCDANDAALIAPLLQARVAAAGQPAPDPDALRDLAHALLITQFSDFIVAELGNRPLGVLQINYRLSSWHVGPYAVIEDFYLAPELRGKGAGHRMLDYACARAQARGALLIEATVSDTDRAANRLYEAFAFQPSQQIRWQRMLRTEEAPPDQETH